MYTQSKTAAQSTTPSPTTTAPTTQAPARSNAAMAEGIAAEADPMATQTVVWDALPLDLSLPMAWEQRAQGFAREWIGAISPSELVSDAGEFVGERVGEALSGLALEVAVKGDVACTLDLGGEVTARIAHEGTHGIALTVSGAGTVGAGGGVGAGVRGVDDQLVAGAEISGGASATARVTRTWRWPDAAALLATVDVGGLTRAMMGGPLQLMGYLQGAALRAAAGGLVADEERWEGSVSGEVSAEAASGTGITALPEAHGGSEREIVAKAAVGHEQDRWFVEFGLTGGTSVAIGASVLRLLDLDAEALVGVDVTVRVWGNPDELLKGKVEGAEKAEAVLDGETAEFPDVAEMVGWLADCLAGDGEVVDCLSTGELPEVTLRRHLSAPSDDAPAALEVLHANGLLLETTDFTKDTLTSTVEAELAVDTEVVRVALWGQSLPVTTEGEQEAVLDVARAVIAHAEGNTYETGLDLDLEGALACAEVKDPVHLAELEVAVGGSVSGEAVAKVGGGARAGAKLSVRTPISREEALAAFA
ncbi:MAG: hypothetical protein ACOZNI_29725 [Myxococcota bacterium]